MIVEIKNLFYSYGKQTLIFQDFGLSMGQGEAWSIIGPSGCGKTTLLYLIAGLLHPKSGEIEIAGMTVQRPRPRTGLILQDHGLLPWATVKDNALLGFRVRSFYGPDGLHSPENERVNDLEAEKRVKYWLSRLGIGILINKYPAQLSRGQRQRTAIARTLALEPDLLLMDEPFSALDAAIRSDLRNSLMEIHRERSLTSIIVTHDIEEAIFMGEKILVLKGENNRESHTIENSIAGQKDFQEKPEYPEFYTRLRSLLEK